jgi:hypothetical protein
MDTRRANGARQDKAQICRQSQLHVAFNGSPTPRSKVGINLARGILVPKRHGLVILIVGINGEFVAIVERIVLETNAGG